MRDVNSTDRYLHVDDIGPGNIDVEVDSISLPVEMLPDMFPERATFRMIQDKFFKGYVSFESVK